MSEERRTHSREWSEMSFDSKMMYMSHGVGLLLFLTGSLLTLEFEATIFGCVLLIIVVASIVHRLHAGWRWPGASAKDIAGAVFAAVLIGIFLYCGTPLSPPTSPASFPWYVWAGAFGLFAILGSLRVVTNSQAEFLAQCGHTHAEPSHDAPAEAPEARWKGIVRGVFIAVFLAYWVEGCAFFYAFGRVYQAGTPTPTADNTEMLVNHGSVHYVTAHDKHLVDLLQTVSFSGFPVLLVIALILQHALRKHPSGSPG